VDRRTKLNTYGIVGVGIATAVGFGLSHLRFSNSEGRIAQLEGIVGTLGADNFVFPNCGKSLRRMLQRFCTNCRAQLTWPETLPPLPLASRRQTVPSAGPLSRIPTSIVPTAENAHLLQHLTSNYRRSVHGESGLPKKRNTRKRTSSPYTKGELNAIADDLLHPLIKRHKELRVVDEIAHVVIEGDLRESFIKFLRFTLPQIVRELLSDDSSE